MTCCDLLQVLTGVTGLPTVSKIMDLSAYLLGFVASAALYRLQYRCCNSQEAYFLLHILYIIKINVLGISIKVVFFSLHSIVFSKDKLKNRLFLS